MTNKVSFQFVDEGDGTGELELSFQVNGYAGVGRAYFEPRRLDQQLDALAAYPLPTCGTPEIQGGYWDSVDGSEMLIQEHLGFSVHPIGTTGRLVFRVRVAIPSSDKNTPVRFSASATLAVSYEALSRFVNEMKAMLRNEISEVTLEELVG